MQIDSQVLLKESGELDGTCRKNEQASRRKDNETRANERRRSRSNAEMPKDVLMTSREKVRPGMTGKARSGSRGRSPCGEGHHQLNRLATILSLLWKGPCSERINQHYVCLCVCEECL